MSADCLCVNLALLFAVHYTVDYVSAEVSRPLVLAVVRLFPDSRRRCSSGPGPTVCGRVHWLYYFFFTEIYSPHFSRHPHQARQQNARDRAKSR